MKRDLLPGLDLEQLDKQPLCLLTLLLVLDLKPQSRQMEGKMDVKQERQRTSWSLQGYTTPAGSHSP